MSQKNANVKAKRAVETVYVEALGRVWAIRSNEKAFPQDLAEAEKILSKNPADITPAERLRLLTLYRPAAHDSGKIAGIVSYDSSAVGCEFCARMREAAAVMPSIVCGACYAAAMAEYRQGMSNRHILNMIIMSALDFTVEELSVIGAGDLNRINSDGDVPNIIYARNMFRLAYAHPGTRWALWAKNVAAVNQAMKELGKPANLILVRSSRHINELDPLPEGWDYVFTVYLPEDMPRALAEGACECNGRNCRAQCGAMCYFGLWPIGSNIAEVLRGSAAELRAAREAVAARRAMKGGAL